MSLTQPFSVSDFSDDAAEVPPSSVMGMGFEAAVRRLRMAC